MTDLVAIVGPSAAGKTTVGLELAAELGGEIVNADSRLFYRGFDIGTAKPTLADRRRVRHHLIDILAPGQTLGLAAFIDAARAAICQIAAGGQVPVLVGGTGQYVWGLLEGWEVPRVPPDEALRSKLEREARDQGSKAVYARLAAVDAGAAARIDPRNVRRVIRAIEIANAIGPSNAHAKAETQPYRSFVIGLTTDRPELYRRADSRIDRMIESGWLDEVRRHLNAGVDPEAPAMAAIGYRELAAHVRGESSIDDAVRATRQATRRLIRHQYNWFRKDDPRIFWIEIGRSAAARALEAVRPWLKHYS